MFEGVLNTPLIYINSVSDDDGGKWVVYDLGGSKHFGHKKSYKKNWQHSQRFWTISNLHA